MNYVRVADDPYNLIGYFRVVSVFRGEKGLRFSSWVKGS